MVGWLPYLDAELKSGQTIVKHCRSVRFSDDLTPKKIKTKSKWDILIEEAATWFKKPQT